MNNINRRHLTTELSDEDNKFIDCMLKQSKDILGVKVNSSWATHFTKGIIGVGQALEILDGKPRLTFDEAKLKHACEIWCQGSNYYYRYEKNYD
jgi:hypothetical protein